MGAWTFLSLQGTEWWKWEAPFYSAICFYPTRTNINMSTPLDKSNRLSPSTSMSGGEDEERFSNKERKRRGWRESDSQALICDIFTGVRAAVITVGDETEGGWAAGEFHKWLCNFCRGWGHAPINSHWLCHKTKIKGLKKRKETNCKSLTNGMH